MCSSITYVNHSCYGACGSNATPRNKLIVLFKFVLKLSHNAIGYITDETFPHQKALRAERWQMPLPACSCYSPHRTNHVIAAPQINYQANSANVTMEFKWQIARPVPLQLRHSSGDGGGIDRIRKMLMVNYN